jgi:ACS family hexuronate transporter-like MFS transporter
LFKGPSVGTLAGLAEVWEQYQSIMNWLIQKITTVSYTPAFIIIAVLAPLTIVNTILIKSNR